MLLGSCLPARTTQSYDVTRREIFNVEIISLKAYLILSFGGITFVILYGILRNVHMNDSFVSVSTDVK